MLTDPSKHGAWPEGYACLMLDEVDSTMAEAARMGRGLSRPVWVMAHKQSAGRGRQGRVWSMPVGNLAATLVFQPFCTPAAAAQRSFLAANALFETLSLYTDMNRLKLKWPNDVLLSGGKVAGILLESSGRGPFVDWLSIGFGVNLAVTPQGVPDAAFPPVSLFEDTGHTVPPAEFLLYLAGAYATQEAKLERLGFDRIRADWLRQAAKVGEEITARTPQEDITGIFDTIDGDGNLVLITAKGPRKIRAADVHF